ncbi:Oxidoreductase [Onygenales sp. PD_40]|nr:Oxidoreductase [Onygenales sp. PD_40]
MFRPASRSLLRASSASSAAPQHIRLAQARRFISTAPPSQKSRSWKGAVLRWGLAAGAVYYYNTSSVFAEQPGFAVQQATAPHEEDDTPLPTLDSVTAAKKTKTISKPAPSKAAPAPAEKPAPEPSDLAAAADVEIAPAEAQPLRLTAEELEEEADHEGAFNPETGEINWDCPCLGGMAHGPCGEEFRTAFSCFVYSTEEPKGIECVEKFKGMQDCFRLHPEIYGSELDEQEVDAQLEEHIASEATDATKEAFPEPPAAAAETEKKATATPTGETTTSS